MVFKIRRNLGACQVPYSVRRNTDSLIFDGLEHISLHDGLHVEILKPVTPNGGVTRARLLDRRNIFGSLGIVAREITVLRFTLSEIGRAHV